MITTVDVRPYALAVLEDYAAYRGVSLQGAVDAICHSNAQKKLADAWRRAKPETATDVDRYYQEQNSYIEDLAWFNLQPFFWQDNSSLLGVHGYVADFGGGIGSLALALNWVGCQVAYIDLPSPQRKFAEWRFHRHWPHNISVHTSLTELQGLDFIVSSDTMEHLHPDILPEITHQMWDALKNGGEVRTVSKFGKNETWPMHYDSESLFVEAMNKAGFKGGPAVWRKDAAD